MVIACIESLEADPIAGVLQEISIRVSNDVYPLAEVVENDVWDVPHGFELTFSQLIIGLVINKDHTTFDKGTRVDMGVKM